MKLDVSQAQAAAREAAGELNELVMWGDTFALPATFPPFLSLYVADEQYLEFFKHLLGAEQFERFISHTPEQSDVVIFMEAIDEIYGLSLPKSRASARSSQRATRKSKPTSKGSTGSNSRGSGRRVGSPTSSKTSRPKAQS